MRVHRKKVLITALSFGRFAPEPRRLLEDAGFHLIWNERGRPLTEDEMVEAVAGADALLVGTDPVTRRVIEAAQRLKIIAKHGVGLDNVDVQAARGRGILVTTTPGANDEAVADLTFGLLLAVTRHIPRADTLVRSGGWGRLMGVEVWGKTLGIVGFGRVGQAVARRARGFDMRILAYDVVDRSDEANRIGATLVGFEDLLKESDFVTLHVPLNRSTRHLLDEAALSLMKPSCYLVNASRGGVVDEDALYRALVQGRLAGAALDVYEREPPSGSPLLGLSNVVFTPHLGAATYESNLRMGVAAARSIIQVLT